MRPTALQFLTGAALAIGLYLFMVLMVILAAPEA